MGKGGREVTIIQLGINSLQESWHEDKLLFIAEFFGLMACFWLFVAFVLANIFMTLLVVMWLWNLIA